MHIHTLAQWQHPHDFAGDFDRAEKNTTRVVLLTSAMMVVEIVAGTLFGSMALLADGWHMGTHVAAFGITLFAYRYARRHADNPRFAFGTGKVGVLAGFASAVALAVVALVMALESVVRMVEPQPIHYNQALGVAAVGLLVNLICGLLLHEHHGHDGEHPQHDHNLRAAYLHVLADALTSVFAILALSAGKAFGWAWLDPVTGLIGAGVITRWAYGLLRETGYILLDAAVDERTRAEIRQAIEQDGDNRIADLHVWYVGPRHCSAGLSVVTHFPKEPDHYRHLLQGIPHLAHVLVEVNQCHGAPCLESRT